MCDALTLTPPTLTQGHTLFSAGCTSTRASSSCGVPSPTTRRWAFAASTMRSRCQSSASSTVCVETACRYACSPSCLRTPPACRPTPQCPIGSSPHVGMSCSCCSRVRITPSLPACSPTHGCSTARRPAGNDQSHLVYSCIFSWIARLTRAMGFTPRLLLLIQSPLRHHVAITATFEYFSAMFYTCTAVCSTYCTVMGSRLHLQSCDESGDIHSSQDSAVPVRPLHAT